jgi:hypothetical protein
MVGGQSPFFWRELHRLFSPPCSFQCLQSQAFGASASWVLAVFPSVPVFIPPLFPTRLHASPLHPPHHVRFPCSGRVDNDSLTLLPSSPIDVWAVGRNRVHLSFSRTNFSLAPEPTLASPPTSLFLDLYSRIEPL